MIAVSAIKAATGMIINIMFSPPPACSSGSCTAPVEPPFELSPDLKRGRLTELIPSILIFLYRTWKRNIFLLKGNSQRSCHKNVTRPKRLPV